MKNELIDNLIVEILKKPNHKDPKEVVEEALKVYLRKIKLAEMANLRGKITWEGNLDEMREC